MSIPTKTKISYPVSIDEAKRHLRIEPDFNDDNDYINVLIQAATAKAEAYIGKDIAETENVKNEQEFYGDSVFLDEGNFISFTDASTGGSSLVVDYLETGYNYTCVKFTTTVSTDDGIVFQYKTGFTEGECPAIIKQAVLIKIADLYDVDRESYTLGSLKENKAFESLLDANRYITF